MSYHFWEDDEYAGPRPSDLACFWDRRPRQLRPLPRKNVPQLVLESGHSIVPTEATGADAHEIAGFWNTHYKGTGWRFRVTSDFVVSVIKRNGFILIIRAADKMLIGTFVCHIIPDLYCGGPAGSAGLLDGFVIHADFRQKGLGSLMLAYMDKVAYSKPILTGSPLLWFREHTVASNAIPQLPTAILQYRFILISSIKSRGKVTQVNGDFVANHVARVYKNLKPDLSLLSADTTDPAVYWYLAENSLIGIADTHRYSEQDGHPFWEVVFAANLMPPYFVDLSRPIMIAAVALPTQNGLMFASNSLTRGNMSSVPPGWTGGGGALSLHLYNWMPPTFFSGDILFPRSCI